MTGRALLAALVLAGCGAPDTTACVARCQTFTAEPAMCQTMCTRSCDELRRSFGVVAEHTCRQMQEGSQGPPSEPPGGSSGRRPAAPAQRRANIDSTH